MLGGTANTGVQQRMLHSSAAVGQPAAVLTEPSKLAGDSSPTPVSIWSTHLLIWSRITGVQNCAQAVLYTGAQDASEGYFEKLSKSFVDGRCVSYGNLYITTSQNRIPV